VSVFLVIAFVGFGLSVIAHGLTFVGINPQNAVPWIWVLHLGIFVVWIPTVLVSKKLTDQSKNKDAWKQAVKYSPAWMTKLCGVLFAYALFNFIFTMVALSGGGKPAVVNGEKVLRSHGKVIRKLTDEEYDRHQAHEVRLFSGHWMLFYGVASTVLLSELRRRSGAK